MFQKKPIQLLDSVTVNQIAAGEVIENAASVVKELLENALDAGADEIELETLGGGQGLIVVKDNGCGMTAEEISLALQRHATSKICNFSDLFSLHSYGFRGEALPSIASISKMKILSSPKVGTGAYVVVEGGKMLLCEPAARQLGTTITVDSLFYNIPVRRGFQKSPQIDRLLVRKILENGVLASENIGWSWISEKNQELFVLKHQNFAERTALIMGEEFMQGAFAVDRGDKDIRIVGFLGALNFHRPTRQGQKIFINDRPVESLFISRKVGEIYSLLLPLQRFPVFVLKLYLPPAWCDFNVHPQKVEVRILREEFVGEKLKELLSEVLVCPQGIHQSPIVFEPPLEIREFLPVCQPLNPSETSLEEEFKVSSKDLFTEFVKSREDALQIDWLGARNVRFLASLGRVVLAEDFEGVYIVFTAIARKHLFYMSLKEHRYLYKSQAFLIPLTLQVTPQESRFLSLYVQEFCQLGIEISQIGPQTFIIESAPTFIEEEELKSWILLLIAEGQEKVDREAFFSLMRDVLSREVFSKTSRIFDASWLTLLWGLGKPEKAFDGTQILRQIVDTDFIGG
ncbi:DNA mismatch repair endonuclease MutL [Chlamydia sp. 17-3921]|uniref:DNA mismatch repair endonuclease MutL n=1 Tax=Chlamydia sp. 17-3921 TaxID=2675798 RepID=UPI00191AD976|nr:DNA mismatch repair endonuclease MutL [Chlamydia sp. 17-3921]